LDVCTGWGLSMAATVKEFRRQLLTDPLIVGVDLTLEMMREGKRQSWITGSNHYGPSYVNADACSLPFTDNVFDAIQVVCGIGGFSKEKRGHVFQEFLRVLKPNGEVILLDVVQLSFKTFGFKLLKFIEDVLTLKVLNWWGWENLPPIKMELQQAGFEILCTEEYTEPFYPPAHIQIVRAVK
jgi:ubiquinone/menaquinone biosynthesis C-methylase UbiE